MAKMQNIITYIDNDGNEVKEEVLTKNTITRVNELKKLGYKLVSIDRDYSELKYRGQPTNI